MKDKELKEYMRQYVNLSIEEKNIKVMKDELKKKIREGMGDALSVQQGNLMAVITPGTRKSLDSKIIAAELEKEGKTIPKKWWKVAEYESFTVKEIFKRAIEEEENETQG